MNYLIPANANRGKLILGYFRPIDLIIFISGIIVTFIFMLTIDLSTVLGAVISIFPGLVCSLLVFPIPHYHNVLVFLGEMREFYKNQKIYHWKGWCYKNGNK